PPAAARSPAAPSARRAHGETCRAATGAPRGAVVPAFSSGPRRAAGARAASRAGRRHETGARAASAGGRPAADGRTASGPSSAGRFIVGGLTAAAVYACYPPVHGRAPIIATGVGSVVLIGALYLVVARLARLRAADWLVVGYAVALVGVAAFLIAVEGVQVL